MTTPIRFLPSPPLHPANAQSRNYDGTVDFDKLVVGDLCFYHFQGKPLLDVERLKTLNLTAHYFAHNAKRAPLILALPDKASPNGKLYFMVDGQCYADKCANCGAGFTKHKYDSDETRCANGGVYEPKGYYDGWTVAGEPPAITVSPSVNYDDDDRGVKHYHGFIQNGVIGDG